MLFVIYIRDIIALRFEPFKRMYENGSLESHFDNLNFSRFALH